MSIFVCKSDCTTGMQRLLAACGLAAGLCMAPAGCARVEPAGDFQRARRLISERTGSAETYDPQAEALIGQRIEALSADGLTVEEAVQVALLNNRALQSAFHEIGVSRAQVVQSRLLTNPSLSLLFQFPEGGGLLKSQYAFGQEIADLWQIPVRKRIAEQELESTVLEVARRAIDLAADVRVRSFELLALQRGEETLRENLRLVEQSLELAGHQFEAGAASQLDVNLVRANVIDVRLELISLQRERRTAELMLARLLNLSGSAEPPRINGRLPGPRGALPGDLLAVALAQRLEARQAEAQARQAEFELRREWLNVFPSAELGFELEVSERRAMPGRDILADTARESVAAGRLAAPNIQSRAERDLERRQIIDAVLGPSLALTLPVWDQNQAQIAAARSRAMQRRKDYEDVLDRVANEVQQADMVARNAEELVEFYQREALPQAEINVQGAQRSYQAGQQSILALIEAQESHLQRRRAYVQALGRYAVAIAELERAVGGRLPAPPAPQPQTQPATP